MGSYVSTIFEAALLATAGVIMATALYFKPKEETCGDKKIEWGRKTFVPLMLSGIIIVGVVAVMSFGMTFFGGGGCSESASSNADSSSLSNVPTFILQKPVLAEPHTPAGPAGPAHALDTSGFLVK